MTGAQGQYSAMRAARDMLCTLAIAASLVSCGSSTDAPASYQGPPLIASKADVIVTLDGKNHTCIVALNTEPQGNNIACNDIVPFVKDELRLPPGAVYDIRGSHETDKAEISRVATNLKAAGYRFIGGHEEY